MRRTTLFLLGLLIFQYACFAAVEDTSCFEHYRYSGLEFSEVYPEKVSYMQSDEVKITYQVTNEFPGPLVEGGVRVLVLYRGPEDVDRIEDDDIVDEFFVNEGVAIQAEDSYKDSFRWLIPADARPGVYVVNTYFPVKRKFNIAGLPFMTSVPGGTTTFRVDGSDSGWIMLDKNSTTLNGKQYKFREYIPGFEDPASISLQTKLLNPSNKEVRVTYELFSWADIEEKLNEYTKTEVVSSESMLEYSINDLPEGVYVARVTASAGDDIKSILKTRFFVKGFKGKINWLGLDHFPLMEKDDTTVSLCISNSAVSPGDSSTNFSVNGKITVLDRAGKVLAEESYEAQVTADIQGKKFNLLAPEKLTYVKLKTELYDDQGVLVDDVEIVYDYTKFVNIQKLYTLDAPDKATDSIRYTLNYLDEYGDPLSGDVVVYLTAPDGKVIEMQENTIAGTLEGSFAVGSLSEGSYILKAVEKNERLSETKEISISRAEAKKEVQSTTTTTLAKEPEQEPEQQDNTAVIILGVLVLIVIVLAAMKLRKK